MHNLSWLVSLIRLATNRALFTIFLCVRVAAFGEPVVPEVNCRLIASFVLNFELIAFRRYLFPIPPISTTCLKLKKPSIKSSPKWIKLFKKGRSLDLSWPGRQINNSGAISCNI